MEPLVTLYAHLHPSDTAQASQLLREAWRQIWQYPNLFRYFGVEQDGQLVATCNLTIIPNLTKGARPFGLLENVVTHSAYQKQGLGRKLIEYALEYARERNCYKVMLLSSKHRKEAHVFYEGLGFRSDEKTGFVIQL